MKLTQYQKDEIIPLLDIRQDTVDESFLDGDWFEQTGGLKPLRIKLLANEPLNIYELAWVKQEMLNRSDVIYFEGEHPENVGAIKSHDNFLEKIEQELK